MKTLVFAAASLMASAAMAFPTVKDKSVFNGIYAGAAGGQIEFTQTLELTKFDAATNKFTLSNIIALPNGQVQTQEVEIAPDQLLNDASVKQILAQCDQAGGVLGETTVPAGTFKTCQVSTQNSGTLWVAEVPFGFVKEIYFDTDMNRIEVELASSVAGQ